MRDHVWQCDGGCCLLGGSRSCYMYVSGSAVRAYVWQREDEGRALDSDRSCCLSSSAARYRVWQRNGSGGSLDGVALLLRHQLCRARRCV